MARQTSPRSAGPGQGKQHIVQSQHRSPSNFHHHKRERSPAPTISLPLQASYLSKNDYHTHTQLFALYLEVQKQLVLEDLQQTEAKGRWKSFVGKWNRGELAEGWYDGETLRKAVETSESLSSPRNSGERRHSPNYRSIHRNGAYMSEDSDNDDIGPSLPAKGGMKVNTQRHTGPTVPNLQDLELRREAIAEESISTHKAFLQQCATNRRQEKERFEELALRAEPGSKERLLEKKKEKAGANRAFATARADGGGVVDVPDADLLGSEDGGIEGFKKQKREMERKKNEREIRREEVSRARAEEREERVKQYRAKEEATMKGLVELAKARFG